jgi:predicted kinase
MDNSTLTLALMAGLPGVGKTTLARALGEELGWLVIDKDELKEQFLRDKDDDYTAGRKAYDWSFEAVRKELANNRSVILDTAALHPFILEKAQEIISSMESVQVRLKVLFLVVDNREERNRRIEHRPPQTTIIRVDPSTMDEYFECYRHLPLPPGSFHLDTSEQPLEKYLPRANDYLVSDNVKYNDDEEKLKRKCKKTLVLSKAG